VSQVVNLTRAIKAAQKAGFTAIGLDADGETDLYQLEAAIGPLLVVVGSEGAACPAWSARPATCG
jgi:23S rRNA (guanosine2251-2'-O)-methyltransferase